MFLFISALIPLIDNQSNTTALGDLSRDVKNIIDGFDRFVSIFQKFYPPISYGERIIREIDTLEKKVKKINPPSHLEGLYADNLLEVLDLIRRKVLSHVEGKGDYRDLLEREGFTSKEFAELKKWAEQHDYQALANNLAETQEALFYSEVSSESHIRELKTLLGRLLRIAFENSTASRYFNSFNEYMETVHISTPDGGSFHRLGRIQLDPYDFCLAIKREDNVLTEVIDVVHASTVVGEEGLTGHQGHYYHTINSSIPEFMKNPHRSTYISKQCIGRMGGIILAEIVPRDPEIKKEYGDMLDLLAEYNKILRKIHMLRIYVSLCGEYLLEVERWNIDDVAAYITGLTGWKYYSYPETKRKMKAYHDVMLPQRAGESVEAWTRLYSGYLAEKIMERLSKLPKQKRIQAMGRLMTGYWGKNTFLKYVDHVLGS